MKKITLVITLLMAVFAISSCKKDKKEETETPVSVLVGKQWQVASFGSSGNTYAELFMGNIQCPKVKGGISPMYIVFNADGTWVNTFDKSFKTCLEEQENSIGQNGTWKIVGNKFTLNNMYKTMPTIEFTVKELTATSFKIEVVAPNDDTFKTEYEIYNPIKG